jgi:hypothetical protein
VRARRQRSTSPVAYTPPGPSVCAMTQRRRGAELTSTADDSTDTVPHSSLTRAPMESGSSAAVPIPAIDPTARPTLAERIITPPARTKAGKWVLRVAPGGEPGRVDDEAARQGGLRDQLGRPGPLPMRGGGDDRQRRERTGAHPPLDVPVDLEPGPDHHPGHGCGERGPAVRRRGVLLSGPGRPTPRRTARSPWPLAETWFAEKVSPRN